jgi:hypothetical protein
MKGLGDASKCLVDLSKFYWEIKVRFLVRQLPPVLLFFSLLAVNKALKVGGSIWESLASYVLIFLLICS